MDSKVKELLEKGYFLFELTTFDGHDSRDIVCAKSAGEALAWYLQELGVAADECVPIEEIKKVDWIEEMVRDFDTYGRDLPTTTFVEEYYDRVMLYDIQSPFFADCQEQVS